MSNNNSDQKRARRIKIFTWIAILLVCFILRIIFYKLEQTEESEPIAPNQSQEYVEPIDGELLLTMIDVGQADAFLFRQNGKTALVDCGTRSSGKDVANYLKSNNIERIDYLFGTHPHDDHMGGMYDIITNVKVGKVIIPEVEAGLVTSNWYLKLMNELKSKEYTVEYPKVGSVYSLGDAKIKVIGPISKETSNLNNYSTVLKVSFGEMDIVMTGDAEKAVEDELLEAGTDLSAEILKLGHHGSDTSTSIAFLNAVNPNYALISSGVGNKYDHPLPSTMENLKQRKITVYRTDESGTVELIITNNDVQFSCEPGSYLCGTEVAERSAKE